MELGTPQSLLGNPRSELSKMMADAKERERGEAEGVRERERTSESCENYL